MIKYCIAVFMIIASPCFAETPIEYQQITLKKSNTSYAIELSRAASASVIRRGLDIYLITPEKRQYLAPLGYEYPNDNYIPLGFPDVVVFDLMEEQRTLYFFILALTGNKNASYTLVNDVGDEKAGASLFGGTSDDGMVPPA